MDTERDFQQRFSTHRYSQQFQPLSDNSRPQAEETEEEKLNLGWLFTVIFRRAPIMIIVGIILSGLFGSIVVLKSRKIEPEYRGGFQILIEPVTVEGQFARQYLLAQSENTDIQRIKVENSLVDYESLIRVLRSPQLMEPVFEKLLQQYPDLNRSSIVSKLEIERIKYDLDGKEQGTRIIKVSYQDLDPTKIMSVLNAVSETYLNYSRQERLQSLNQGIDFINEQLPGLRSRFKILQSEKQQFQQKYNFVDPETAVSKISAEVRPIQLELANTKAELSEAREIYLLLQQQWLEQDYVGILGNHSQSYNSLIRQYQELESQMAVEAGRLREDSFPMQALREKHDNVLQILSREAERVVQNIANQVEVLTEKEKSYEQTIENFEQQLREIPRLRQQYDSLDQELQIVQETLNDFLKKREALRVNAAQQQTPWQLIAPPNLPIDSNGNILPTTIVQTKKNLAIIVILSFLLGVGIGFIIDILIEVFHHPDEIKSTTKLPILGVIPLSKKLKKVAKKSQTFIPIGSVTSLTAVSDSHWPIKNGQVDQYQTGSPVSEAFRSLYANICLLSSNKSLNTLTISSATLGDGKSTIAIHLAQTAAFMGQRVLLVDADLRNPQIHQKLGLPNLRGFRDAITSDLSLNDAIQRSPQDDNLFVLTAGQIPPDPVQVLSAKKRQYLMEQFRAFFDLVIYDTPAVTGLADTSLIAAQTDGIILVVGIKKTNRSTVLKSLEELNLSNSVLGLVANRMRG
ncbi:capsular exopolysaccharide family domain protein [Lyngbya aestuarii BL J]|uniref:Capsular exopolysaccharide family domain protein n=1 Tax=Lyngbya aestuarii BL J TaxID=1348334 RepID=U7QLM9_9CYAN|nr:polysaccharide biosynthesis tyrosine autokinase [Lyngbya aestuarii]ERT07995.1 capsular exopolysaccharide family domain protein [Lyngbya aestuarii BL J]